jgi:hypothetical protein
MPMRRKAAWVGSKPSRVITLGLAVALESFTARGLGGGDVMRSTEVGFDGFALFINNAVEVTAYLERMFEKSSDQVSRRGPGLAPSVWKLEWGNIVGKI